jgi:N-acetylglucosamine-6-phosphate deacetylase
MATSIPSQVVGQTQLGQIIGRSASDLIILSDDLGVKNTLAGALTALPPSPIC